MTEWYQWFPLVSAIVVPHSPMSGSQPPLKGAGPHTRMWLVYQSKIKDEGNHS